jgi:uncharacterized phiE125 gp8 family phage protein
MNPRVILAPKTEPFTLDECRQHLRIEPYELDGDGGIGTHPDDWWIMKVGLPAAREHCENFLGLSLARRTLEYALNRFPATDVEGSVAIELPMGPVVEIVSVMVGDPGSDSSLTSDGAFFTDFHLDNYVLPSALWPTAGAWPAITGGRNAIRIRYVAGYGVDSDGGFELPNALGAAILLVLGHLYEHREDTVEKALQSIPLGAEALMRPLRVRLGMA